MASNDPNYRPIKIERASDLIAKEIWNLILAGKLKPGDKLPSERELVKQFEVSKVTLREALNKLEAYGHITKKRGQSGGSIVLDIAPTQGIKILLDYLNAKKISLEELIATRDMIEPLIAAEAAKNRTNEDINELEDNLVTHKRDFEERGCSRCAWRFYLLLARFTQNEILRVIEELLIRIVLDKEFSLGISDLESNEEQMEYNKTAYYGQLHVAETIKSGNPQKAREAMDVLRRDWAKAIREIQNKHKE